jgi:hypothetical protein
MGHPPPLQTHIQWVPGLLLPGGGGVKNPGREADNSPPLPRLGEEKIFDPARIQTPDGSARSQVVTLTVLFRTPRPLHMELRSPEISARLFCFSVL